jgi:hypothetical protein
VRKIDCQSKEKEKKGLLVRDNNLWGEGAKMEKKTSEK